MRRSLSLTFRTEARKEANPAPIWAMGPPSRRPSRSDGNRGGEGLDHWHPLSDDALLPVEAVDHGVRAVALRFGGEREHQEPRDEPA